MTSAKATVGHRPENLLLGAGFTTAGFFCVAVVGALAKEGGQYTSTGVPLLFQNFVGLLFVIPIAARGGWMFVRTGRFGPAFAPGSPNDLQTRDAVLDLSAATVTPVNSIAGAGPTSPSVRLNLPITFKPSAAGRSFRVLAAASDDLGNEDAFALAGTVTVEE